MLDREEQPREHLLDACKEANLPKPFFENFSGGFRIKFTLPAQTTSANVPLNVPLNQRIWELIKTKPGVQRKDIAVILSVTEKTVSRCISEFVAAGKIERRGSKKTGGYYQK